MRKLVWWGGAVALVASVWLVAAAVDPVELGDAWRAASSHPLPVVAIGACYWAAFALRSWVWSRVLPGLPFRHALAALHVSLLGNHVLPARLGEALRVTSVIRRAGVPPAAATASTVVLRGADVVAVVALAAALGPALVADLAGPLGWVVAALAGALWLGGIAWLRRLRATRAVEVRAAPIAVGAAALTAWVLESAVMWQAARWAGLEITYLQAVLVTAVTIAAQVVAIAPGGIGTYEAAATAALASLGFDASAALAAAIGAHAVKTSYALVAGGIAAFVPGPGMFGRLRLARDPSVPVPREVAPGAPVMLFLPAHNEAESIAGVVARTPTSVLGRDVACVVIDDGSTDDTAERARRAGAEVISLPCNRGLGAAVRAGLAEAVRRGVSAVAFCDADGEYAPEELGDMVAPILEGRADYVVGSRFAGDIRRMLPHRRVGNVVLTKALSFVARRPISDGQSGYRAFSPAAAADAEVIHDFNYAQVLTLDLLAKGYRYEEVPISYGFREAGRSFVKLGRYLRHVIPAVHREINSQRVV